MEKGYFENFLPFFRILMSKCYCFLKILIINPLNSYILPISIHTKSSKFTNLNLNYLPYSITNSKFFPYFLIKPLYPHPIPYKIPYLKPKIVNFLIFIYINPTILFRSPLPHNFLYSSLVFPIFINTLFPQIVPRLHLLSYQ